MMRSVLVFSADCHKVPAESLTSGASAILLQLGPSAETAARAQARDRAREFLDASRGKAARPQIFAQIAPLRGDVAERDLAALVSAGLDGVFLEGCEGRADVQQLSVRLSVREAVAGLPARATKIVALAAQTPASIFALGSYNCASGRLAALAMDETPLPGGAGTRAAARPLLALAAAAAGVAALDIAPRVHVDALEEACRGLRQEGFSGVISHSAEEISTINRIFRRS